MKIINKLKKILSYILLYIIFINNSTTIYATTKVSANILEPYSNLSLNKEPPKSLDMLENLNLNAENAVLMDAKTGLVLYDKNMHQKVYPASTTKIMTSILALENGNLNDIVKHSHNAVFNIGPGSSHIGMRENEELTLEQALYGVLLASANEVSMAVAEYISGSVDKFVAAMNEKAKVLGALNTSFANPHGFHDDNHYTTSYDMALFMKEAIKISKFVDIIKTETYTIPPTNIVDEERILNNTNKLIKPWSPYYYEYCIGGKTGFTNEAGNTLVSYAKKGDIELISVVMKDKGTFIYEDTKTLFDYGFSIFETKQIFDKSKLNLISNVYQDLNGETFFSKKIETSAKENVTSVVPKMLDPNKVNVKVNLAQNLKAPINIGDVVGYVDLIYNNTIIGSVDLTANESVPLLPEKTLIKNNKKQNLLSIIIKTVKYILIALILLIISFFVLSFIVRNIKKYKRRKMRRYYNYNNKKSRYFKTKRY